MKQRIYIFIIVFGLFFNCSKVVQNYNDLVKVKIGMHYREVNSIMNNKPLKVENAFWNDSLFIQNYESPSSASDDYKIVFTKKDSIVVEINYGD
ncbi:hypothetical protein ACPDHL_09495 [Myroides sp. C15-4]|uniref:hypothetical protein n=1 Tax=Myroides sp. C15-4 TaxID=3400532 RepID=UPI003D2F64F5